MNQELYAELETETARQLARTLIMVDERPDIAEELGLTDTGHQEYFAKRMAETYVLLRIAKERGIYEPDGMGLPEPVITAKIQAEGDSFQAALEAMDRLQQEVE